MADLTPQQILETKQKMLQYQWYHTVELAPGVVTPGQYDLRPVLPHYGLPADLSGKTVLDVGPSHGFFAFEFEKRRAQRVVTVELPRWSAHDGSAALKADFAQTQVDTRNEDYLHGALDFAIKTRGSKIEQLFYSIYEVSPQTTGVFDVVFCGSLLIHLTDPLRALYALRSVTRDYALIATPIDPETDLASRGLVRRLLRNVSPTQPRAYFHGLVNGQAFWAPNMLCLERWALAAGFKRVERVSTFRLASLDGQFDIPHGTIRAFAE